MAKNPRYKELTLPQLRGLCETSRHGSFTAAAHVLGTSQPTVWKQVHALEREFGVKLVEPHGRGCTLTAAGRRLVEMVGPAVEAIASAREQFAAALADAGADLTVAVTPRELVEDLAPCVGDFLARSPRTRFSFLELPDEAVAEAVLARRADFGYTPAPLTDDQRRLVTAEPGYATEVRLLTPKGHPLARRRSVHPRDLRPYPCVNGPNGFSSEPVRATLERYGAYRATHFRVHTEFAGSIRRFVKLGLGVGLVWAVPSTPPDPDLHERPMSRHLGGLTIHVVQRKGAFVPPAQAAFVRLVRERLRARP